MRRPLPVRSRSYSAARIAAYACSPVPMSVIEMPTLLGASSVPGHRQHARFALHEQVVGFLLGIRPRVAVTRDVAHDEARMLRMQRLGAQPQARGRAGREVLDEHVRALDEPGEDLRGFGVLHVEREAFLGAVEPHEIRRLAFDRLVVVAREIADFRALDLDHARAEIGELARSERRGDRLLERNDGDAFEWKHVH